MTMLDYLLIGMFAAVWIVPLVMGLGWERRLRAARAGSPGGERGDTRPSTTTATPHDAAQPVPARGAR